MSKWTIRCFRQVDNKYCAIASRTAPGKRWIVNAEGNTEKEAIQRLKVKLNE